MDPDGSLAGQVALVTGASRGIGLACARVLHERGATVVLTARTREAAVEAAATLGPRALGVAAHAADEDSAHACVDLVVDRFGSIDILVNNAGTNPAHGRLVDQDAGRFDKTIEVNLRAPLTWSSHAWHRHMGRHGGSIVNTASTGGLFTVPDIGVYNAAKAGLIHLTRQLAVELAPGVRVNAVAPGVVRTRLSRALWEDRESEVSAQIPLARIGEPRDVAEAVAFLASSGASWITGQTLVIDGGQNLGQNLGQTGRPAGVSQ